MAVDPDIGKSLLGYDLCRALILGDKWLGFSVPKMRVLILQLEEGAGCVSRLLKAHGFFGFATKGEEWELGDSFDLAKPRHRQLLQSLIRKGFDFILIDPLRAVSSLAIDENTAEFGKRVVRPLRKLITEEGATALLIITTAEAPASSRATATSRRLSGGWLPSAWSMRTTPAPAPFNPQSARREGS